MLENNLESYLYDSSVSWKNEIKSIMSAQIGNRVGFVIEIDSQFGKYYAPVFGFRTKEAALLSLRNTAKREKTNANI